MQDTPLGLYIHVPFCTVKCSYCDFNSYAGIEDMQTEWEAAALTELSLWAPRLQGREVSTVFIGGGTPSLLPGESIERILDTIRSNFSLSADAEITLEANPESVQPERLQTYRAAGVNRISMGVQSLDSDELFFLDRIHSAERAEAAFAEIRSAGFVNVNLDLIYGLPGQSLATWQSTLERVLTWSGDGPDHISCYALTVEEGTPLAARVASGQVVEANPDHVAELADWTANRLAAGRVRTVRDQQLCAQRPQLPAQPDLLAQSGIRGHRTGRAWLHRRRPLPRRPQPEGLHRSAPRSRRDVQRSRRSSLPRHRRRRASQRPGKRHRHADLRSPAHGRH